MQSIPHQRRETLQEYLAGLIEDEQVVYNQLSQSLSDVDKLRLQRQLNQIKREIQHADSELRTLDSMEDGQRRRYLDWQEYLPEIDFQEAVEIFEDVHKRIGNEGGGVTFLIQNGHVMGGRLCVTRFRNLLKSKTADLRHYPIEFPPGSRPGLTDMLNHLEQYLGCEPCSVHIEDGLATQQCIDAIWGKWSTSLQSGSIVFLELRLAGNVGLYNRFLPRFLSEFWQPLLNYLPNIIEQHPMVSFVTMIVVDTPAATDPLPPGIYCTREEFHPQRILELPLQNWTRDEIKDWLFRFGGLTAAPARLTRTAVENLANDAYQVSNQGLPALVNSFLHEKFESLFKEDE